MKNIYDRLIDNMSKNKYEYFNTPSTKDELLLILSEGSGKDKEFLDSNLDILLCMLTPRQRFVTQSYYLFNKSILTIRYELGCNSNRDIDRCLKGAVKRLLELTETFN